MLVLNVRFLYLNIKQLDIVEYKDDDVVEPHILIDLLPKDG